MCIVRALLYYYNKPAHEYNVPMRLHDNMLASLSPLQHTEKGKYCIPRMATYNKIVSETGTYFYLYFLVLRKGRSIVWR